MNKKVIIVLSFIAFIIIVFLGIIGSKLLEQNTKSRIDSDQLLLEGRKTLEEKYPEYKNWETKSSFAGTSISYEFSNDGNTVYLAYILHGSGVPIGQVKCFSVDKYGNISIIGTFPGNEGNTLTFSSVDPKTCEGRDETNIPKSSDYCSAPESQYWVTVYEGVTTKAGCNKLGGQFKSFTGWDTTYYCEVK